MNVSHGKKIKKKHTWFLVEIYWWTVIHLTIGCGIIFPRLVEIFSFYQGQQRVIQTTNSHMSNSDQGQLPWLRSIILVYGLLFTIDGPYVSHGPPFCLITDRYCGPGRLLNKVLYGEAPPGGSNPWTLIYQIFTKMEPLSYQNCTPFLYLRERRKQ